MEKSNDELAKRVLEIGKDKLDIENVVDCDRVIEIDLSLVPNCDNDFINDLLHEKKNKDGSDSKCRDNCPVLSCPDSNPDNSGATTREKCSNDLIKEI